MLIGMDLAKWMKLSVSDKKDYLKDYIFKRPEFCNRVLEAYKDESLEEIDYKVDDNYFLNKVWQKAKQEIDFSFLQHSSEQIDSFTCAKIIVENFEYWVENNGGWEVVLSFDSKKREKMIQRLVHLSASQTVKENNLDFSCEVNNGHGPEDFKVSRGIDKTVIELKLSSNPQYLHGYTDQIRQYAKSENTSNMIYVLIDVGNPGRVKKLENMIFEDSFSDEIVPKVYIIDANEQKSASIW